MPNKLRPILLALTLAAVAAGLLGCGGDNGPSPSIPAQQAAILTSKIDEIQRKVAEHFNIKLGEMTSDRRARAIARPRQVAMYLAKQLTTRSLPQIGRKFGGRDHTTVMHAVRKIEELTRTDPSLAEDVELLRRMLQG